MSAEKNIRLRQRVDTNSEWTNSTGTLLKNEMVIDSTNNEIRIGTSDASSFDDSQIISTPRQSFITWDASKDSTSTGSHMMQDAVANPMATALLYATNGGLFKSLPASQITIEYKNADTTDWTEYPLADIKKMQLVGSYPNLGGDDVTPAFLTTLYPGMNAPTDNGGNPSIEDKLRITLSLYENNHCYTSGYVQGFAYLYNGAGTCRVTGYHINGNVTFQKEDTHKSSEGMILKAIILDDIVRVGTNSSTISTDTAKIVFEFSRTAASGNGNLYQLYALTAVHKTNSNDTIDKAMLVSNHLGIAVDAYNNEIYNYMNGIYSKKLRNGSRDNIASGIYSHAEGQYTKAQGKSSHAEGESAIASGACSHAEGYKTQASSIYSHAEGFATQATSTKAHSEGQSTIASEQYSHSEGYLTQASGAASHAEGNQTIASGENSHSEGSQTLASGKGAHSSGVYTNASGQYSHVEGYGAQNDDQSINTSYGAIGSYSHAEGFATQATATYSHAEGRQTITSGPASHAEGQFTKSSALSTHAEGYQTVAANIAGHSEGFITNSQCYGYFISNVTFASGLYQITLKDVTSVDYSIGDKISVKGNYEFNPLGAISAISGNVLTIKPINADTFEAQEFSLKSSVSDTLINGTSVSKRWENALWCNEKITVGATQFLGCGSHSEGSFTYALRAGAHAEGYNNEARGFYSHAEGYGNIAEYSAHAEGHDTTASGEMSHTEGYLTKAAGEKSHAEGEQTVVNANWAHGEGAYGSIDSTSVAAHLEGIHNMAMNAPYAHVEGRENKVGDDNAHAEGKGTLALAEQSHAEGYETKAYGKNSHSEGSGTNAGGESAHAEGNGTTSSGLGSHSEGGDGTRASGDYSHAEGRGTLASATAAHAEGYQTTAEGAYAHAEGGNTLANGEGAHAEGVDNYAFGEGVHVQGKHAVRDISGQYAHIVGGGTWADKKNIHTLDWSGNAIFAGTVTSSDGKLVSETTQVGRKYNDRGEIFNNYTYNTATGVFSHAHGSYTQAAGANSTAQGYQSRANADTSFAAGNACETNAWGAIAMGNTCKGNGASSFAIGVNNESHGEGQFVHGKHAIIDTAEQYAEIVGNGLWGARKNIYTLDWNGSGWYKNGITIGDDAVPLKQNISLVCRKNTQDSQPVINFENSLAVSYMVYELVPYSTGIESVYCYNLEDIYPASIYDINIKYDPVLYHPVLNAGGDPATTKKLQKAYAKWKPWTGYNSNELYCEANALTNDIPIVLEVYRKNGNN